MGGGYAETAGNCVIVVMEFVETLGRISELERKSFQD
jgi:hypothetical protein